MALYMTVDDVLNLVKKHGAIPVSQITFSDSDIINFMNEEVDITFLPQLLSVKEEFYVSSVDIPVTSTSRRYKIPYRAVGSRVRNLSYVRSDNTYCEMSRIQPEQLSQFSNDNNTGDTDLFYLENDNIVLVGSPSSFTGSLRLSYYIKPNDLVKSNRCPNITVITEDELNGVAYLDFASVPSNITTGSLIDLMETLPNHRTLAYDIVAINVDNALNRVTIDLDDLPDNLVVGDYIASAGECKIPQIPSELHSVLVKAVVLRVVEAQGDMDALKLAEVALEKSLNKTLGIIDSRTEGNPQKINNMNSLLKVNALRNRVGFRRF